MDDALKADRPSPRVVVFSSATKFYVLIEVLCDSMHFYCPFLWLLLLTVYLIWNIPSL